MNTSALARLGERGIPADAIVRLCAGPLPARRITVHVVHALAGVRRAEVTEDQLARLWAPVTLLAGDLRLEEYRVKDWVAEMGRLLQGAPVGGGQA